MTVNKNLSETACWKMVNKIQNGKTPQEIRERCRVAEEWLKANEVISVDAYDNMMMAVSFLYRESYHLA